MKWGMAALMVLAFGASAEAAGPVSQWPALMGPATSASQCQSLDDAYTKLRDDLDRQHAACLSRGAGRPQMEAGGTCSRAECQPLHDALYNQLEKRRTLSMNSCRQSVSQAKMQCFRNYALKEQAIHTEQDRNEASYRDHCYGQATGDMATACRGLKSRMDQNAAAISRMIGAKMSECGE